MALLNQFPYDDLETTSTIRLIKLEKRKVNGLIVCDVLYREQTRVTYTALSYRWGDDTEIRQIYLRRSPGGTLYLFPVHDSLGRFLDWAWNQKICSTWIWTDKICLNQRDGQEKEQQIPRMGDIFHNAETVLVWLDMTETEGESLTPILDFENYFRGRKWGRHLEFKMLPQEMQRAIKTFSRLAYWRRVWVVQECAVAKKIVFVIGNKQASFESVESGVSGLCRTMEGSSSSFAALIKSIRVLTGLRLDGGKKKLWELLEMMSTGYYLSRDAEDRFYGAMALVADQDGTSPLANIEVNKYKKSSEVLLDAVLEAQPPVEECGRWFQTILFAKRGMIQAPIFEAFQNYLESEWTSDRHKELMHYALEACDAMNIITSLPECRCIHKMLALSTHKVYSAHGKEYSLPLSLQDVLLRREDFEILELINCDGPSDIGGARRKTTIQDNAIFMGLSIADLFYEQCIHKQRYPDTRETSVFRSWKACRMSHALAYSPWRCATHQLPGQGNERLRAESSTRLTDWFDTKTLAKACRKYSRNCDGSKMTFENREAGFRFTIRPDKWPTSFKCRHTSTVRIEWLHTEQTLNAERESNQRGYGGSTGDAEEYPFMNSYRNTEDSGSSSDESDSLDSSNMDDYSDYSDFSDNGPFGQVRV